MKPECYNAAAEGKFDVLFKIRDQLAAELTPNRNTVLHISCLARQTDCALEIAKNCPSLLHQLNAKRESPLHLAARKGQYEMVKAFIDFTTNDVPSAVDETGLGGSGSGSLKDLLRLCNEDGNTALHEAVRRRGNMKVVKLLIENDPEFTHLPNNDDETPLYLAAERGFDDYVAEILQSCTSPSYAGPCGRTALHATVIVNSQGSTERLLKWKPELELAKRGDLMGWTPLHYAARLNYPSMVKMLVESDMHLAYIGAVKDNNNTALHVAARKGNKECIQEFLTHCPDCFEMVNAQGKNVLHFMVEKKWKPGEAESRLYSKWKDAVKIILDKPFLTCLINQKDIDGNTPLHSLGSEWIMSDMRRHPESDNMVFNKQNLTPLDIAIKKYSNKIMVMFELLEFFGKMMDVRGAILGWRFSTKENKDSANEESAPLTLKEAIETGEFGAFDELYAHELQRCRKQGETHMVVAALVVTIAFTAGITMPGGYIQSDSKNPNQGMAVLSKKAAFQAFIISDTIALLLSSAALVLYFFKDARTTAETYGKVFNLAGLLTIASVVAVMVAFFTATYSVLGNSSALAIATCVVGSLSFISFLYFIGRIDDSTEEKGKKQSRGNVNPVYG